MLAMGCEDVCLVRRMNLVGEVEIKSFNDFGWTVSNREDAAGRLLSAPAKQMRKEHSEETQAMLENLPAHEKQLGTFKALCDFNGKLMKARLKKVITCHLNITRKPSFARLEFIPVATRLSG